MDGRTLPSTTVTYDLSTVTSADSSITVPDAILWCRCDGREAAVAIYPQDAPVVYATRAELIAAHMIERDRLPRAAYQWSAADIDELLEGLSDEDCERVALATGR